METFAAAQPSRLTLLLVEDDPLGREMVLRCVSQLFSRVFVAVDGEEGLARYRETPPDLILTDQLLPGISGLEMVREIRSSDHQIPVILMTSSIDNEVLLEAIDVGVSKFVPKPINFRVFTDTLTKLITEIENKRLLARHRQQEMELLRYRNNYHSLQQEAARRKERHVVRDDLCQKAIMGGAGRRWVVEAAYVPRDIMCGDAYTIRQLPDGRLFIFLVDAMGSGLFASLSAMLAVSFSNYLAGHLNSGCGFTVTNLIDRFHQFLSLILLEDEVLSCGFVVADLSRQEADAALFALPPLLVRDLDGTVRQIRSANPPFCSYTGNVKLTRISLTNVAEILLTTDGVTDAELAAGGVYREIIRDDFRAAPTLAALQRRFHGRIAPGEQDDHTLLALRCIDLPPAWSIHLHAPPRLHAVGAAVTEAMERIAAATSLVEEERDEVELVLTEAMMNALEHGCLGMGEEEKRRLILDGSYDEVLANREAPAGSEVTLHASLWKGAGQPLLTLEVRHSGACIPLHRLQAAAAATATAVNGRGLLMISRSSDSVFVADEGASLVVLKALKESGPAE